MSYCWKCGKPLPEGANFCIYCGAPVKTEETEQDKKEETKAETKHGLYYDPGKKAEKKPAETQAVLSDRKSTAKEETVREFKLPKTSEEKPVKTRKTSRKKATNTVAAPVKEKKTAAKKETVKEEKGKKTEETAKRQRKAEKEARKAAQAERKAAKKARKREKKARKKEKKKKSFFGRIFRFVRNALIIILCANLIIVGLAYAGVITEDFDIITAVRQLYSKIEDMTISYDEPADVLNNDDPALITIRYSDRELRSATGEETSVTPDNHVVSVGGLTVDMGRGNLEGNDTLIVKDLGRKDDDNLAMALHCYDLSLKSGTDQFAGLVKISIPLDLGDKEYLDGMVYFDEQSGQWEDLYYEVSADGRTAIAYMDHFTKVSPKIGKMTAQMFDAALAANSNRIHSSEFIKSAKGDTAIPASLFVEVWNKMRQTDTMDYLYFRQYPTMRNVGIHNDTLRELFALSGRDITATPESINNALIKLQDAVDAQKLDWPSRMLGIGDATTGAFNDFSVLNGLLSTGGKIFSETAGKMIGGLNIIITGIKLYSEYLAGKDMEKVISDNNLSIVSSAVTALGLVAGTVAGLATWPITVLGIGLCLVSLSLDVYRYTEGLDELPMQEQAYFAYYNYVANDKTKIPDETRIGFDKENFRCKMEIPTGVAINEKDASYKRVMSHVKKYGLNEEWVWNSMIRLIFKNSEKEPDKLQGYVDDLLYKYADSYWNLSKKERDNWVYQWMHDQGYKEEDIQDVLDQVVLKSDIEAWRKDKMNRLMLDFRHIFEQQVNLYTTKSFTAFKKEINREFLQPLNYTIYFYVEDKTLDKGMTFRDSIYAQDYRNIVFNKERYFKNIEFKEKQHITDYYTVMKKELPDYADIVTPMRFVGTEYPLFYPYQVVWDGNDIALGKATIMDRYPHTPEYLPWVAIDGSQKSENLVFITTVYHYIQMGQPTRVLFKDVTAIETWEDAQKYYDDPGVEVSFTIPKFDKKGHSSVRLKVTGDGELTALNGYWEGPWLGSSKQWYYFNVDTESKKIEIEDTLGLPTESFTIRRYKYDNRTKTLKFVLGWGKERATLEFKMTGMNSMVLYIEYNGDNTSLEFVRSTRERFDNWENRQKFSNPDPSQIIPNGDEW
jgi:hypothetical protein